MLSPTKFQTLPEVLSVTSGLPLHIVTKFQILAAHRNMVLVRPAGQGHDLDLPPSRHTPAPAPALRFTQGASGDDLVSGTREVIPSGHEPVRASDGLTDGPAFHPLQNTLLLFLEDYFCHRVSILTPPGFLRERSSQSRSGVPGRADESMRIQT